MKLTAANVNEEERLNRIWNDELNEGKGENVEKVLDEKRKKKKQELNEKEKDI